MRITLMTISLLFIASAALAQSAREPSKDGPWFGVHLPPHLSAEPAVIVGDRTPRPVMLPTADPRDPDFSGAEIRKNLERIVQFSKESRATHEIGSGQLWGRISGYASGAKTIEWAVEQFRKAGIADAKTQPIRQEPRATSWIPLSWEVRLIGDAAFGAGTADVVLESAMPLPPSSIDGETLTAPLIFVGSANASLLDHLDVRGKLAVQLIVPQGHTLFERGATTGRAKELFQRGAVGVLNLVRLPGNELTNDFNNCGGPCFNIGGRDGLFLESLLDRAAQAGKDGKVRAQIRLKSETQTGLQAQNGVAVIRGKSDETIIIDAHADAWFDGAGDNADGLAVMIALARHFAKPANKPARTLIFVASAGHHSAGINGPRNFIAANPEWAKKAVLVLNIEHVAQRNFSPARSVFADEYRQTVADSGEAPIVFGVSNDAPFLNGLAQQGVTRYGTNFISEKSTMQSGETGGFADVKAARVTVMQAAPLYHTSGEILDVISTPGLERMARFLAYFIKEASLASRAQINP